MFVKNLSDTDIFITKIFVNGDEMKEPYNDRAYWWRVCPNPIKKGKVSDVMVKLRNELKRPAKLEIETDKNQKIREIIFPEINSVKITAIAFEDKFSKVYVYVQNNGKDKIGINRIELDGIDCTKNSIIWPSEIAKGEKTCLIVQLKNPLKWGEYVDAKITTTKNETCESVVRVFSFFPIYAYGNRVDSKLNFDTENFMLYFPSKSEDWKTIGNLAKEKAYLLVSCANCSDKRGGLGYYTMEVNRQVEECLKNDPIHPTGMYVCENFKDVAYFIYNELTDVMAIDPYEIVYYQKTPEEDVYFTALGKSACEPRPLWTIPEAFKGEKDIARAPTPEEERLIVYEEISAGSRGIFYWTSDYFPEDKELANEIGKINGEIRQLKEYLLLGEAMPLITNINRDKIKAASILCGDKAIIILLLNQDYKNYFGKDKKKFEYTPKENITVTIKIPEWMEIAEVYEVGDSRDKVKYESKGGEIYLKILGLDLTRQIILKVKKE